MAGHCRQPNVHATNHRVVSEAFAEEKALLRLLPAAISEPGEVSRRSRGTRRFAAYLAARPHSASSLPYS